VLIGIVGASLDPASQARSRVLVFLLVGVPLVAILVGWGVWLAVTYALRPVTELAERADEVAQGAAPWRLDVSPDAVELQSLAESLDGLLEHLRAAFESERRFLDDASHELRTPIAVARGELDLLRAQLQADPEMVDAVGSAIEEIDRLDRLAADLLLLARARGTHHHIADCDLAGLARRATGTLMREPGQRDVEVRVRGDARAEGDEHALERVLRNTIANAVSNCNEQVSIDIASTEDGATIVVSDDGTGFPDEMTGSSFPRFATGRGRRSGGTGLGLAIAAAIVEAHNGRLVASNRPEGGAQVTIRIPIESASNRRGRNGRGGDRSASSRPY
jgi:signal transduction histidine kinase